MNTIKEVLNLHKFWKSRFWKSWTTDSDGNAYGSEDYERVTNFTMIFITDMFRYDDFRFDSQGNLLLDTFEDKVLKINPETFELPSLRGILGLE